jgi:nicotinate-nucleotide pyrophosphorylase
MNLMQPMEYMISDNELWELKVYNQAPVVFSAFCFINDLSETLDLEISTRFSAGDFLANESEILAIRGKLGSVLIAKEEYITQFANLLNISTVLYRLKTTINKNAPNMKLIVRNVPEAIFRKEYFVDVIEDSGSIYWPMSMTDGIVHSELWKQFVDIKGAIDLYKKKLYPGMKLMMECANMSDSIDAMKNGADGIILRNMRPDLVAEITKTLRERFKKVYIEYIGDVKLSNIEGYAKTGVDSLGIDDMTALFGKSNLKMELKKIIVEEQTEADDD